MYEHRSYGFSVTVAAKDFTGAIADVFTAKVYEPVQRNKDGIRWIRHRFPIKGGISQHEVMMRDLSKPNLLFAKLVK